MASEHINFKNKAGYKARENIIKCTNQLVCEVWSYLKNEWEKVKTEAKEGPFS